MSARDDWTAGKRCDVALVWHFPSRERASEFYAAAPDGVDARLRDPEPFVAASGRDYIDHIVECFTRCSRGQFLRDRERLGANARRAGGLLFVYLVFDDGSVEEIHTPYARHGGRRVRRRRRRPR